MAKRKEWQEPQTIEELKQWEANGPKYGDYMRGYIAGMQLHMKLGTSCEAEDPAAQFPDAYAKGWDEGRRAFERGYDKAANYSGFTPILYHNARKRLMSDASNKDGE